MKKICLILLLALSTTSCNKYEPLHFERTPYFGNEVRTDGFWYQVNHSGMSDWMTVYFMYRDGTLLMTSAHRTTNPSEVTVDDIPYQSPNYYNQALWGVFVVEDDTLKWSEWFWPGPGSGKALLYNYVIINDTCIQSEGEGDYYYFHPFEFKPDSTIARQWIP